MIEIAKAVSSHAKIIVMDEPTSSLTQIEVKHLFRIINKLRDKGCGIIYISHKMEEIKEISDDITIMRDGKWVSSHFPAKSQNRQKCPKFSVSHPQMNNSTSSPHNSIVAHPTPQIWAYFIKSSKQTFWQPQFFFFWHTRNPSKHLPKIFRGQFSNRFFGGRGRAAAIGGGARSYL